MKQSRNDILIVGAGPTGLTLACALLKQGIHCRIIDKRQSSSLIPRAINISHSTLAIFAKLGIDECFWQEGLKLAELTAYWHKQRLININYKYAKTPYPYFFHLEQSRLEIYLTNLLQRFQIKIERGTSIEDLDQSKKDQVDVLLKKSSGEIETCHFSYVIGCDGGNSRVRDLLNIVCQEQHYPAYFVLMDAVLEHAYPEKQLHYYLTEAGYLMVVPLPKDTYRLIASFKGDYPGKENVDLSEGHFQMILNERGPGHLKVKKSIWSTSAGFYHKLANRAQKGSVLLAGDALHQFSPVGGTNMNTGIQDAYCLADKITNLQNCTVLQSYGLERLKVANRSIKLTETATYMLTRSIPLPFEEQKYLPLMKNRQFIKSTLPRLFAGIDLVQNK